MQELSYNMTINSGNSPRTLKLGSYYNNFAFKSKLKAIKSRSLTKNTLVASKISSNRSYFLYIELPSTKSRQDLLYKKLGSDHKLLSNNLLVEQYFFVDLFCEKLTWFNLILEEISVGIIQKENEFILVLLVYAKSKNNYSKRVIRLFINSIFSSFYITNNLCLNFFRTRKEFSTYRRSFAFKNQSRKHD